MREKGGKKTLCGAAPEGSSNANPLKPVSEGTATSKALENHEWMDKRSKRFDLLPAGEPRPNRQCCLGPARLFSYFLSYVKMQNFAQHPGRGVSLLSSIKFHFENIRGSLVQVVKPPLLFLLAPYVGACGDAIRVEMQSGSDRWQQVRHRGSDRGLLCCGGTCSRTCSKGPVLPRASLLCAPKQLPAAGMLGSRGPAARTTPKQLQKCFAEAGFIFSSLPTPGSR